MTRDETKRVIAIMMAAYPNYKPTVGLTEIVDLWSVMLSEYSLECVLIGLKTYIATDTKGFPPAIGQLIDQIHRPDRINDLNEMEAWALVSKAIKNGLYGAEKEYEKLPEMVQKAVGSPSQLRSWAMAEGGATETVIQSNFIKTYRTVYTREEEIRKLPEAIRQLYSNIAEKKTGRIADKIISPGSAAKE